MFFWCETSIFNGSFRRALQDRIDFHTHTHTERMGSSVFHVSMVIQRCSKTFPLVCCSLNFKTAQSFTHTHIRGNVRSLFRVPRVSQPKVGLHHMHIIFKYFLCLTTVVATLTAVWHFVKNIIKNNSPQYNFETFFRLIKAHIFL